MTRVIEDVNSVERVLIDGTEQGSVALLSVAGVAGCLFYQNATLAWIAMLPLPLLSGGALWYTLTAHRRYRAQREAASAMNALLMDNLQGVRQIKAYGQQAHEDERFARRADDLRRGTLGVMRIWARYSPAMSFAGALGSVLVLWFGGGMVLNGTMTLGQLVGFLFFLALFYEPIARLHGLNQMLQAARAAGERVFDILDSTAETSSPQRRSSQREPVRGEVIYEHVSFSYSEGRSCCATFHFMPVLARWSRWSAPPAPANPRWSICCLPSESSAGRIIHRWAGHQQHCPGITTPSDQRRQPGTFPFQRHGGGEHSLRQARCDPAGVDGRGAGGQLS
jgi:ABC-type multidrug transport system fused ATPase/permease subunit